MKVEVELLLPLNNDESTINICKNLWQEIKSAYDRIHKKRKDNDYVGHAINDIEEEEEEKKYDNQLDLSVFQPKKNRNYKLCTNLKSQRKKERVAEIKKLIIKIANPTSSEANEYFDKCNHGIEDTVHELCKSLKIVYKPLDGNSAEYGANDAVIDKKKLTKIYQITSILNCQIKNMQKLESCCKINARL